MEQQFSLTGDEICNEFDCPLVELSQNIFIVDPKVIMGPVSIALRLAKCIEDHWFARMSVKLFQLQMLRKLYSNMT